LEEDILSNLFQPYETIDTRQVIDLFQNHFLKSIFRAATGRSLPKVIDHHMLIEKRREALLAAIEVLKKVREKGIEDNAEDRKYIISEGNKFLDISAEKVAVMVPQDEQETIKVFQETCHTAKLEF
jgi:hypothetical protein